MQSFFHKIRKLKCGWNEVPLDEDTFHRLCSNFKIKFTFMPLDSVYGFYTCTKRRHYIAVDHRLPTFQQAFVMFHELAHFLMHSPSREATESYCGSSNHSRDEQEADAFAYCALLPLGLLRRREPEEIAETYGSGFLMKRLAVYERYGI